MCNGVLPIDKLRDFLGPMQYVCLRIPKQVFEVLYKIRVDLNNPTAAQILQAYSKQRGYIISTFYFSNVINSHFTGRALPDEGKAARIFLKDVVNGKLLFCQLPPTYDKQKDGEIIQYNEDIGLELKKDEEEREETKEEEKKEDVLEEGDRDFLGEKKVKVNDDEFFEDEQPEEDGDDPYEGLDNTDLLIMLLEGKVVKGVKLTKEQRRDIKFALKRGDVNIFFLKDPNVL